MGSEPPVIFNADLKINLTIYCDKINENYTVSDINNIIDLNVMNQTLWNEYGAVMDFEQRDLDVVSNMTMNCGQNLLGCPSNQVWCTFTPAMTLTQFIIGYFLTCFGYPIGVTLIQTLFSKLLGARPQVSTI